jgi:hypothetical protein
MWSVEGEGGVEGDRLRKGYTPGSQYNTNKPHRNEKLPYVKNIACQLRNGDGGLLINVKQYASRPPTICCPPFIIYQNVTMEACSDRLYHMEP